MLKNFLGFSGFIHKKFLYYYYILNLKVMKYMLRFVVNIVCILCLFYVGITLIVTPEKANFSYYIFVVLMLAAILYENYRKKIT